MTYSPMCFICNRFQTNDKPRPVLPPFKESLIDALNDRILLVTACLAVFSIITGLCYSFQNGWIEGVCILAALFLQVLITALNDYAKDNQFVKLQNIALDEQLPVIRGKSGAMQTLNVWDLVVGDVVLLTRGDKAPADCVVIEATNCLVNQAVVTKDEADLSLPLARESRLLAGSFIVQGEAKVVVCAVGAHSTRGIKDKLHDTRDQETTLSQKLDAIGGSLKYFGLIAAIVIFVLSLVLLFISIPSMEEDKKVSTFFKKFADNLTLSFIILIVAIPEGIPMTIGISLAYSVLTMFEKDNLLVRDLTSVEEMGMIQEIILGKTGTMTTEEMQVLQFYFQDGLYKNSRRDSLKNLHLNETIIDTVIESIVFNNSAYIEMTENSFYAPVGNGTEVSLLKWLQDAEVPVHEIIKHKQIAGKVRYTLPFESRLRQSVIAVEHPDFAENDTVRVYIKGAPETLL